ncbi:MAG: hypothetical protein ABI224_16910 [Acetobacteraceae bacterium]
MSPHDIRRLALAHELLVPAAAGHGLPDACAKPDRAEYPGDRTPAIDLPRDADG